VQPEPKEHRLFHYTPSLERLSGILANGFWPRYCVEEFDWLLGGSTCMAFPIVCFCDIPIPSASAHRECYGHYAIAVRKAFAQDHDINPVWYIQEGSSVGRHLAALFQHSTRVTLDNIPDAVKPLLPFLKSTIGAQPNRQEMRKGVLDVLAFEEELEWRHSPPELTHTWKFGYTKEIVKETHHDESRYHRLALDHADIDSVYVRTKTEVDALLAQFPTLDGKITIWKN